MQLRREQIVYRRVDELIPYVNNPRHNEDAVDGVAASIREFGFKVPMIVKADGEIVTGHTRILAAKKLGIDEVPTICADDLTDAQIKAFRLADNKVAEKSGWDFEKLEIELEGLDELGVDMGELGFTNTSLNDEKARFDDWQNRKDEYENASETDEEYEDFLKKFEAKKTTDDCYTPEKVYEAVAGWVEGRYGEKRQNFVRPFYPGGDYKKYKYAKNSIVVDNPPFSILAEILRYYDENNIKFFLFAPALVLFSSYSSSSTAIGVGVSITYENNATVATSFLTNLEDKRIRAMSSPSLYEAVKKANDETIAEMRAELPKYNYPNEVLTSPMLSKYSKYGIEYQIRVAESKKINSLDAQKKNGKSIYGKGYLISERAAAERAAAERAVAERAAAERAVAERAAAERAVATQWELSEEEISIVKKLTANV